MPATPGAWRRGPGRVATNSKRGAWTIAAGPALASRQLRAGALTTSSATATGCATSFREQGLCVASGVVEAGCKTVIGSRLKRAGMHWTVAGANAVIALRCCKLSGRYEDFWESRSLSGRSADPSRTPAT